MLCIDLGSGRTDIAIISDYTIKHLSSIDLSFLAKNSMSHILTFVSGLIDKHDIRSLRLTGAGAKSLLSNLPSKIRPKIIDETEAIGKGGLFLSGEDNGLIVNIGTGTCIVSADKEKGFVHIGGSGLGAGTLHGLSNIILGEGSIDALLDKSASGSLSRIDLKLSSLYPQGIGILSGDGSASHFGRPNNYCKEDIALGLLNMVASAIGTIAAFAAGSANHAKIILTGKLAERDAFSELVIKRIKSLSGCKTIIPPDAGFATVIGAGEIFRT